MALLSGSEAMDFIVDKVLLGSYAKLNILSYVQLKGTAISNWIFTASDGTIKSKSRKRFFMKDIGELLPTVCLK